MKRLSIVGLILGLVFAWTIAIADLGSAAKGMDPGKVRQLIAEKKVATGMAIKEVKAILGEPTKVGQKTQACWGVIEEWIYGEGKEAVILRFENGKLQGIK
ncbi:MAG: hypothetical protein ACK4Z6_00025 [Candidatus Methylomirabilales bacterium]